MMREGASQQRKAPKLTTKVLETLLTACENRLDKIDKELLPLRRTPEHTTCPQLHNKSNQQ